MNLDFDDVFDDWDEKALGIASIGEVHKCKLKSTGEEVAVKFQFPGMEKRFRADIKTLKSFCKLAMPQHVSAFNEIERQFVTEFDYTREAENLDTVRTNVLPIWGQFVNIPKPHLSLCSKHLLTMEYLEGVKLVDGIRGQYKRLAESLGVSLEDIEKGQKEKIQKGEVKQQTLEEAKRLNFILRWLTFFKNIFFTLNPFRFLYNLSPMRLIYGPADYYWTEELLDLSRILELLIKVHASELFRDGIFNGDCHPGNILLLKDGRLGLIDYGQVKRLTIPQRILYAKLILALARDDRKEIVRIYFDEMGTRTKFHREDIAYSMSVFYNDRDTEDICGKRNIASFIDWMEAEDPMVELPEAYIFCARVSLMLRGMGNAFGVKLRISKLWEEDARRFLATQGITDL